MMVIPGNTVLVGSAILLLLLGEEVASFVHYTPSHSVTASRQWAQTQQKVVIQAHENPGSLSADNSVADRRTILEKIVQSTLAAPAATPLALAAAPSESNALSPEEAATAYDSYAATYNDLDGGSAASMLGINEARGQLLGQAKGHVLELAVGTGLNLDSYNPQQLSSLTLVDISDGMLQEAKTRFKGISKTFQGVPVKFVKVDATSQELVEMFGKRSFDTVVDTFSLCVFGNEGAEKCLDQVRKIVKTEDAGGMYEFALLIPSASRAFLYPTIFRSSPVSPPNCANRTLLICQVACCSWKTVARRTHFSDSTRMPLLMQWPPWVGKAVFIIKMWSASSAGLVWWYWNSKVMQLGSFDPLFALRRHSLLRFATTGEQ